MATHFLEPDPRNRAGDAVELRDPVGESQVAHAAAVEPTGPEAGGPARDASVEAAHCPARRRAEVQSEYAGPSAILLDLGGVAARRCIVLFSQIALDCEPAVPALKPRLELLEPEGGDRQREPLD
jgi:hypothetical protein